MSFPATSNCAWSRDGDNISSTVFHHILNTLKLFKNTPFSLCLEIGKTRYIVFVGAEKWERKCYSMILLDNLVTTEAMYFNFLRRVVFKLNNKLTWLQFTVPSPIPILTMTKMWQELLFLCILCLSHNNTNPRYCSIVWSPHFVTLLWFRSCWFCAKKWNISVQVSTNWLCERKCGS